MNTFEAAIRRQTQQKFRHLGRAALYFVDPAASNPLTVRVCVTDRTTGVGDLPSGGAELEIESPYIEFLSVQVQPTRGAFVSLGAGIAYQIEQVMPADELTVTARVSRVRGDKLRNFRVP